jgi:hypothetical protein
MTRLRSQLRSARQAYRCARYPGDLSVELLGKPDRTAGAGPSRRWLLLTGVATSAAAAAVMLSLLMSRAADLPRPWHSDPSQRALVDWLPITPEKFPVPKFQGPTMPDAGSHDLALPYPNLKPAVPNIDLNFELPPFPELPARGVEWLRKAWHSIESA